jgi:hypothetical protein
MGVQTTCDEGQLLYYYNPFTSKSLKADRPCHRLPKEETTPVIEDTRSPRGLPSRDAAGRRTPDNNSRRKPSCPVRRRAVWESTNNKLRGPAHPFKHSTVCTLKYIRYIEDCDKLFSSEKGWKNYIGDIHGGQYTIVPRRTAINSSSQGMRNLITSRRSTQV